MTDIMTDIMDTEIDGEKETIITVRVVSTGERVVSTGELAGVAYVGYKNRKSAYIRSLFVKENRRRMKIGTELVEACISLSIGDGHERIGVMVTKGNVTAEKFYTSIGFVCVYEFDDGDCLYSKEI